MLSLCNSHTLSFLKPQFKPIFHIPNLNFKPPFSYKCLSITSNHSAATTQIDMVRTKDGIYTAKPQKVVILWDLDNKPPRGPPYDAAISLKNLALRFGEVVDFSAYANRHAFIHLPKWVVNERRERKSRDILEKKGVIRPSELYVCGVCGRKCRTNLDLKKHFRSLHEREREKKLNRMKGLKGKKRQKFKERYISGNFKYNEAAKELITPKSGYGLAGELRRAGVFVKTVEDKPQAADWAVKRQMMHSMSRGVDWIVLVSDDSDFREMLRKAREGNLGTVVVGDMDRALGSVADLWVSWVGVENGEVSDEDLVPRRRSEGEGSGDGGFGGEGDLDSVLDELVGVRSKFNELSVEEEELGSFNYDDDSEGEDDDYFSDSEDEETGRDYRYF
ncbi:Zinc finger, C2H2 domain containing protein [Heracleum sosnowskyi]|uniref:Zinc finger, C2H2 domain containing protein n=1 Tax=Heracleum sosnowskyi TaxID=360622 RepID=A0AAD8JPX7_9APIA|nr:Zinc finger, C2H2 domain containing protein [Heracleum sosnowskyi]